MCDEMSLEIMCSPEDADFLTDKRYYTDYAYDILNSLFENEENRIFVTGKYHQNVRDELIDIMRKFGKSKKYSSNTLHLAVLYLDTYMDSYILSTYADHRTFVAYVSLILAAKIEENDDMIPSIKEVLQFVDFTDELGFDFKKIHEYEPKQVRLAYKSYLKVYSRLEYMILETLKFNAIRPTAITFLNVFQKIAVTELDMKDVSKYDDLKIKSMADLRFYVNQSLKTLSDISLDDISFYQFCPSKVASAMIATTRKLLGTTTIWTLQLEFLTRASLAEIQPIIMAFMERISLLDDTSTSSKTSTTEDCDSGFQSLKANDSFNTASSRKPIEYDDNQPIIQSSKKFKST